MNYNRVPFPMMQRISHYDLTTLGNYTKAIKVFDKAIEINPHDLDAWISKGNALSNLNKYDDALKAFDNAIEIDPQNSLAWKAKAAVLIF